MRLFIPKILVWHPSLFQSYRSLSGRYISAVRSSKILLVAIKTTLTAHKAQFRRGLELPAVGEKVGLAGLDPLGVSNVWNKGSRGPIEFALDSDMLIYFN
jgi:hypothetical protein